MKNSGGTFEAHRLESMGPSMDTRSIEIHIVKHGCFALSAQHMFVSVGHRFFFWARQGTLAVFKRYFRSASSV